MIEELIRNKIKKERAERILEELKRKYNKVELFDRGRRSVILRLDDMQIAKLEKDSDNAKGCVEREAKWLQRLNKHGIGPRLAEHNEKLRYLIYEFIPGEFIGDVIEKIDNKVITGCLKKARKLDELGIVKEEMHSPRKHIVVNGEKVRLLDFERSHESDNPKNVSQLISYFYHRGRVGEGILELASEYKNSSDKKGVFEKILMFFQ